MLLAFVRNARRVGALPNVPHFGSFSAPTPSPFLMLTLCRTPCRLPAPNVTLPSSCCAEPFLCFAVLFDIRILIITIMYCIAASVGLQAAVWAVPCSARCRRTTHRPRLSVRLPSGNAWAPAGRIFVKLGRGCWGHVHIWASISLSDQVGQK